MDPVYERMHAITIIASPHDHRQRHHHCVVAIFGQLVVPLLCNMAKPQHDHTSHCCVWLSLVCTQYITNTFAHFAKGHRPPQMAGSRVWRVCVRDACFRLRLTIFGNFVFVSRHTYTHTHTLQEASSVAPLRFSCARRLRSCCANYT